MTTIRLTLESRFIRYRSEKSGIVIAIPLSASLASRNLVPRIPTNFQPGEQNMVVIKKNRKRKKGKRANKERKREGRKKRKGRREGKKINDTGGKGREEKVTGLIASVEHEAAFSSASSRFVYTGYCALERARAFLSRFSRVPPPPPPLVNPRFMRGIINYFLPEEISGWTRSEISERLKRVHATRHHPGRDCSSSNPFRLSLCRYVSRRSRFDRQIFKWRISD